MKIRYLSMILLTAMLSAPAFAAEGLPGATVKPDAPRAASGDRKGPGIRCEGDSEKCAAQRKARQDKFCAEQPEKCREMQARRAEMQKQCEADPAKCREMKGKFEQHRAQCQADPEKCRQQAQAQREQRFKQADTDGNGMLSRAEAEKGMPRLARNFDRIDSNKDGQLSRDELAAARKAREGAGKGEGKGRSF